MKKLIWLVFCSVLVLPLTSAAQKAFDGTWKIDMSTANFSEKPDVLLLQGGVYQCVSCVPPFKGKADGTDQPIEGVPYIDTVAAKVVNDHEVDLTFKKAGKVVGTSHLIASSDGNTLTIEFSDSSNTNGGPPVTGKGVQERVAKAPDGAHIISGSWKATKSQNLSQNALTFTYKISGDELTMTNPTGQAYTAKLDGSDAPMKGDPGVTSVSVRLLNENTLEETDKRDGKVVGIQTMTMSSDGKSAKVKFEDKISDRTSEFQATKE